MATAFGTLTNVLKENYSGETIQKLFYQMQPLWKLFKKRIKKFDQSGKYFYEPHKTANPQGFSALSSEASTLPSAGHSHYGAWKLYPKYYFGKFKIYGFSEEVADGNDKGAFVNAKLQDFKGLAEAIGQHMSFVVMGDGSGTLCTVGSIATNGDGTANVTVTTGESTLGLAQGLLIDIYNSGSAVTAGVGHEVTAVVSDTVFTIDETDSSGAELDTADVTAADVIVRTRSYGNEIMGLGLRGTGTAAPATGIIEDSGTFQTIDRSTNLYWQAPSLDADDTDNWASPTFSVNMLDTLYRTIGKTGFNPMRKFDVILTTWEIEEAYGQESREDRRFVNVKKFDLGWDALHYRNIPFLADAAVPAGNLAMINGNDFRMGYVGKQAFHWKKYGNSIFHIASDDTDSTEAIIRFFGNYGTRNPRTCGKIFNIEVS